MSGTAFFARAFGALGTFALLLALGALAQANDQALVPDAGPNDPAEYRYFELDNGMGVLLISDERADKAAASLDILVGSGDDPDERPGLAHFTEHMLFLGTEKYPDPSEYHRFISEHGGTFNAYTAFRDTNYFFDIDPEHLEGALDRFSTQFLVPTFEDDLIDQERSAVHSEFTAMAREEPRRFWSAFQASMNPEHRFTRFAVGNLETLSNEDGDLRDETIAFYENRYSANLMRLVVVGPQSLDELESLVRPRFEDVKNHDYSAWDHDRPLFAEDSLPQLLEVQPIRDTRQMQLVFPIPSTEADYASKPVEYLAHLIGHEGPNSLHDVLRRAGMINELYAGQQLDTGNEGVMVVGFELTQKGLEHWEDIVSLTFDYVDQVREDGIDERYFDEVRTMKELDLKFLERVRSMSRARDLSRRLHRVDPQDVIVAPWLLEDFDPSLYEDILERLVPDNVQVSILADHDESDDWDTTEWYETPYRLSRLDTDQIRHREGTETLRDQLELPAPNPFIPEDLSLVDGEDMDQPVQLHEDGPIELWYARDTRFDAPRGNLFLSVRSPVANDSPRSHLLTRLMLDAVEDELNAIAYTARMADLDYRVSDHLRGYTLRISGYTDKMPDLLSEILPRLRHPLPTPERFEVHRQRLMEDLGNALQRRPQQIATGRISESLLSEIYGHQERLDVIGDLTLEDLYEHMERYYEAVDPALLVHGNFTQASALGYAQQLESRMFGDSDFVDVPRSQVETLVRDKQQLSATVDHSDVGYARYLQGDSTDFEERARFRVLAQMLSAPFYNELRTAQQVGYIVHAAHVPLLEKPALAFIVQSPEYDAATLDERVDAFLTDFLERIEEMSEEDLERHQSAVVTRLAEEETRLREVAERYWEEIDRGNTDFDTRERLIEAVRNVSREDLLDTFKRQVMDEPRQLLIDAGRENLLDVDDIQPLRFEPRD